MCSGNAAREVIQIRKMPDIDGLSVLDNPQGVLHRRLGAASGLVITHAQRDARFLAHSDHRLRGSKRQLLIWQVVKGYLVGCRLRYGGCAPLCRIGFDIRGRSCQKQQYQYVKQLSHCPDNFRQKYKKNPATTQHRPFSSTDLNVSSTGLRFLGLLSKETRRNEGRRITAAAIRDRVSCQKLLPSLCAA